MPFGIMGILAETVGIIQHCRALSSRRELSHQAREAPDLVRVNLPNFVCELPGKVREL